MLAQLIFVTENTAFLLPELYVINTNRTHFTQGTIFINVDTSLLLKLLLVFDKEKIFKVLWSPSWWPS